MRGKGGEGGSRITSDKSYDIFYETLIKYDWEQKMILSVPKIKYFFSNTPEKWNN